MLSEMSQAYIGRQTLHDLTHMWHLKKSNLEVESRMGAVEGWEKEVES
jgi:hypothetical protein